MDEKTKELKAGHKVLHIPIGMIVLVTIVGLLGFFLMMTSPTEELDWPTVPIATNHVSYNVIAISFIGLSICILGLLSYIVMSRRVAKQLGVSLDEVYGQDA